MVKGTKLRDCIKRSGDQVKGTKSYAMLRRRYVRQTEATMQRNAERHAGLITCWNLLRWEKVTSIEGSYMLFI